MLQPGRPIKTAVNGIQLIDLTSMSSIFHLTQKSIFTQIPLQRLHAIRTFHASTSHRDLVAPPDPISHMRPILYDDPPSQCPAPRLRHPYSLSEFKTGSGDDIYEYELQYKLLRQQLDSLHQSFWFDVSLLHNEGVTIFEY